MTLFPQTVLTAAAVQQLCPHEYVCAFFTLIIMGGIQLLQNRCAGISYEYCIIRISFLCHSPRHFPEGNLVPGISTA